MVLDWSACLNTSFIYRGFESLQNLNEIELTICLKWSFTGSQLIFSNSFSLYKPSYSNLDQIVCICFGVFAVLSLIFLNCILNTVLFRLYIGATTRKISVVWEKSWRYCFKEEDLKFHVFYTINSFENESLDDYMTFE